MGYLQILFAFYFKDPGWTPQRGRGWGTHSGHNSSLEGEAKRVKIKTPATHAATCFPLTAGAPLTDGRHEAYLPPSPLPTGPDEFPGPKHAAPVRPRLCLLSGIEPRPE